MNLSLNDQRNRDEEPPRSDSIKERLNKHVKRRLQQDSNDACTEGTEPPMIVSPNKQNRKTKGKSKNKTTSSPGSSKTQNSPKTPDKSNDSKKVFNASDILTLVLTEKRAALLQDPQVLQALQELQQKKISHTFPKN